LAFSVHKEINISNYSPLRHSASLACGCRTRHDFVVTVLKVMYVSIVVLWVVTQCIVVGG